MGDVSVSMLPPWESFKNLGHPSSGLCAHFSPFPELNVLGCVCAWPCVSCLMSVFCSFAPVRAGVGTPLASQTWSRLAVGAGPTWVSSPTIKISPTDLTATAVLTTLSGI